MALPFVMISFITYNPFILGSWAESYPENEISPNIHGYNQIGQYKIATVGNFYVFRVTFTTVNEIEENGGAICIVSETNLLIESSIFINCHSKGEGGAIYFSHSNGKSILKKVCSTSCYSSKPRYHFCYIYTKSSDQCTNRMEYSSVANLKSTAEAKSTADTNVKLCNSNIIILKYDNISLNQCYGFPIFYCLPSKNSFVSYTSFENNTSADWRVMGFFNNKAHDINACNIIRNTNVNSLILVYGSLNISNSCLIENTNPMFEFWDSGDTCTIINCTIDSTDKNGYGSVTVDSNRIPPQSFINILDNNGCFSMNDSDDTKDSNSNCVCMTLDMIGNRCNMLRRRKNYIFLIY